MPQHRSTRTIKKRRRKVQQRRTRRKVQQRRTRKRTSKIQSILFKKDYYTKKDAISWLKSHGFKYNKIDVTEDFYRARQFQPRKNKKYRTLIPTPGIRLIIQI
ncbi:MAG: hypothetical protein NZZ41_08025 [Candidatus Dojkabacteria bacterium]|nr:hypothetical protein [Candidatus Dojkabacteria bacterium]